MQQVKIIKADLPHKFIYLVPLSDFHYDEPPSDHETIQGYIDWIASHDNAYTILNGDLVTAPTPESLANMYEMGEPGGDIKFPSLDACTNELEELLSPIKNRILAACSGGHELKHVFKTCGYDWTYNLMKRLGREEVYARDGGILLIKIAPLTPSDNTVFSAVFTHGWGSARTRGAKIRKLEMLAQAFEVDMVILSHDHTQNLTRDNRLVPLWDGLDVHRVLLVATGGFRGYSGYPFRSGYQPADLGTPRIRLDKKVDPDGNIRKDIHGSL